MLGALPDRLRADDLVAVANASGDVDLWRLASEYLPLTFSRRHGDPSRPWNSSRSSFATRTATAARLPRQLARHLSELGGPGLVVPGVRGVHGRVFLNASTADGYNPYRISRAGVDWEVPEPDNPWANIGYWGDHQIIYLLKLLETSERFHPGRLDASSTGPGSRHADVPYRIATYAEIAGDPHDTIRFDADHDA